MDSASDLDLGRIVFLRRVWIGVALVCLTATFALIFGRNYGGWLTWLGNAFQAVYVTLTFSLVVLTYRLFKLASGASLQNERLQRTAQLPIVVCDLQPLYFSDGRPAYDLIVANEGGGPAFDIRVSLDLIDREAPPGESGAGAVHLTVLRSKSEERRTLDVTDLMLAKPWSSLDLRGRDGFPGRAETTFLLANYELALTVTYRDVYGSAGCTIYRARRATGEDIEAVRIQLPEVRMDAAAMPVDLDLTSQPEQSAAEQLAHIAR